MPWKRFLGYYISLQQSSFGLAFVGPALLSPGVKKWKVLESRYVWQRPWFALRIDRVQTSRGAVLDEYPVIEARDWACVIAVTEDKQLVLVRQYRHGVAEQTLEFPAGGVDEGEEPLAAAQRELLEETGFAADSWHHLRSVSPEPTRRSHQAHFFLALAARRVSAQRLEPSEDVEVVLRPASSAMQLAVELSHGVHIGALLLALRHPSSELSF